MVKVFLLKNVAKDLAGFSSLVEKGFLGQFLCMVFLLMILVVATFLFMVKTNAN